MLSVHEDRRSPTFGPYNELWDGTYPVTVLFPHKWGSLVPRSHLYGTQLKRLESSLFLTPYLFIGLELLGGKNLKGISYSEGGTFPRGPGPTSRNSE